MIASYKISLFLSEVDRRTNRAGLRAMLSTYLDARPVQREQISYFRMPTAKKHRGSPRSAMLALGLICTKMGA